MYNREWDEPNEPDEAVVYPNFRGPNLVLSMRNFMVRAEQWRRTNDPSFQLVAEPQTQNKQGQTPETIVLSRSMAKKVKPRPSVKMLPALVTSIERGPLPQLPAKVHENKGKEKLRKLPTLDKRYPPEITKATQYYLNAIEQAGRTNEYIAVVAAATYHLAESLQDDALIEAVNGISFALLGWYFNVYILNKQPGDPKNNLPNWLG